MLAFALLLAQGPVSVASLLPQMTDLTFLTHRPRPAFTMAQSSSYDRHSNPGPNQDWFANGDAGNFLRTESVNGHREYVLADLKGPGAVVRIWSANPAGQIRFYFDGESRPRLTASMVDLLSGRVDPFNDPFAYNASNGTNLYFPFPYAQSLKITVDDTDKNGAQSLYYHVGYRTYAANTKVQTFAADDVRQALPMMRTIARQLLHPLSTVPDDGRKSSLRQTIEPGKTLAFAVKGSGTVRQFTVQIPFPLVQYIKAPDWEDPHEPQNVLRNLILKVSVGGKETISTPLGDFFGSAGGLNPNDTFALQVNKDGTMTSLFPIPFRDGLKAWVQNTGPVPVPVKVQMVVDPKAPSADTYTLHAQWQAYRGPSRPFRVMNYLTASGEGLWVGSNLHIANSSPAWWGEGDERVYVDGESFPSTFGTGTEDYYGYAWSSPNLFHRPYHSQAKCDGPGTFGHSDVNRFQIFDPIPYTRRLQFDMELWHWADVPVTFAYTAFWYAPVASRSPVAIDRSLLLPPKETPPGPVEGALEGEAMRVLSSTGGTVQKQTGFWETSGSSQLWWTEAKPNDQLMVQFQAPGAGRYEVFGHFCYASDYGIHALSINGQPGPTVDFYSSNLEWKKISLGTYVLPAGPSTLVVECKGKRPGARDGQMFGLDYLMLEKR